MSKLAGSGYTPQDLGRLAAAQSLANRGITHAYVSSRSIGSESRWKAADRCVSCGTPAGHPVHAAAASVVEPSGRYARPRAGRSAGRLPERTRA